MTKPILFLNKLILEVYPCSLYFTNPPPLPLHSPLLELMRTLTILLLICLSNPVCRFYLLIFFPSSFYPPFIQIILVEVQLHPPLQTPHPFFYLAKLHYPNILLPENICNTPPPSHSPAAPYA